MVTDKPKLYTKLSDAKGKLDAAGFTQPTAEDKKLRRWANPDKGLWAWLMPFVVSPDGKIEAFYFQIYPIPQEGKA